MNVAAPPALRPEDFPDVEPRLLETLTRALRAQADALAQVPDVAVVDGVVFTSEASGVTTVDVRNPLVAKPRHVSVCVKRDDRARLAAVWSFEFDMAGESIRLSILGLPASVKMRLSLEVR